MAEHGTRSKYNHDKCRCDECTTAHRLYMGELFKKLRERTPPENSHGKISTYRNYGCRCAPCVEANAQASRIWRESHPRG